MGSWLFNHDLLSVHDIHNFCLRFAIEFLSIQCVPLFIANQTFCSSDTSDNSVVNNGNGCLLYVSAVTNFIHILNLSSTSNHNAFFRCKQYNHIVLYLSSTSNHNPAGVSVPSLALSYTFLLHQTTTMSPRSPPRSRLSYTFLLHQTTTL